MTLRRASAALLALVALSALAWRIGLNMQANGWGLPTALWEIFRYFTIWTNFAVGILAALIALRGRMDGRIFGGLVMAIAAVGIVYHALLAHLNDYTGIDLVLDETFHTLVPIWFTLHWLAFEPKERITFATLPLWLAWPGFYCVWALGRAQFDGQYPYFFLDIADHGGMQVTINILGLIAAFAVLGAVIVALAKALTPRQMAHQG